MNCDPTYTGGEGKLRFESTTDIDNPGGTAQGRGTSDGRGQACPDYEYTTREGMGRGSSAGFFDNCMSDIFERIGYR